MGSDPSALFLLLFCLATRFAENTGKLQVTKMKVPDPFIYGSSTDLYCNYTWDSVEDQRRPRTIYSIKWYKDSEEFFRYVPSEDPPIISFHKDGVFVDESRSSAENVHLRIVHWNTAGTYRCEVTADDFETASMTKYSEVVAVPAHNPYVTSQNTRYSLGELVEMNCTANSSDPVADLFWYINSEAAQPEMLIEYPRVREQSNLLSAILGLKFRIGSQHIKYDTVKVKCTAMLGNVYMKSNEISFKVKAPQNAPALESREKNGKSSNRGANDFTDVPVDGDSYMLSNMDGRWRKTSVEEKSLYGTEFENPADPISGFGNIFRTALAPSKASNILFNPFVLASLVLLVVFTI